MLTSRRKFFGNATAAVAAGAWLSLGAERRSAAADAKPKTILLRSAWDTVNIGDIGHTPGTLRILEEHLPQVRTVLWAASLNAEIESMLRRRFPKVEILRGKFDDKRGPLDEPLKQAFAEADLFLRNSGMGQDLGTYAWCRDNGKPFGIYGQSYFPNIVEGEAGRKAVDILSSAAFIYCRDGNTLKTLQAGGVKSPVLEFGPDGCFGIDVRDDDRALPWLQQFGLEPRKFITIQLRTHTAKHKGKDGPPLNPLHATPQQKADDERRAAVFRELITGWVKRTGYKVLIAPEVEKEAAHNKRLLFDPLPADVQSHVVNRDRFWNADEAASVFAVAHTAVCHEPHSLIIALANGTPIVHTFSEFHSPKCWMFRDIGLPEWLLEFDSTPASKMLDTLLTIDADYPAAQAKVAKAMQFVHDRQKATMQTVAKVIGA
ncbi:MAG: polysaccharide pyruvyl transferase family protein [Pirellulales bacterium]